MRISADFIKYCIVAVVGTLVYIAIFFLLQSYTTLRSVEIGAIAFIFAFSVQFFFNMRWTFSYIGKGILLPLFKYVVVSFAGFLINISGIYITIDIFLLPKLLGILIAISMVSVFNFTLNRLWTFPNTNTKIN